MEQGEGIVRVRDPQSNAGGTASVSIKFENSLGPSELTITTLLDLTYFCSETYLCSEIRDHLSWILSCLTCLTSRYGILHFPWLGGMGSLWYILVCIVHWCLSLLSAGTMYKVPLSIGMESNSGCIWSLSLSEYLWAKSGLCVSVFNHLYSWLTFYHFSFPHEYEGCIWLTICEA